jgi:hypothetical protein
MGEESREGFTFRHKKRWSYGRNVREAGWSVIRGVRFREVLFGTFSSKEKVHQFETRASFRNDNDVYVLSLRPKKEPKKACAES